MDFPFNGTEDGFIDAPVLVSPKAFLLVFLIFAK